MTDPTPAGVHWGTYDTLKADHPTYDALAEDAPTYDESGFTGIGSMKVTP